MKAYIHARLGQGDRAILESLKRSTGASESELVRRGLQLVSRAVGSGQSARALAGSSVGKFKKGLANLSTNQKHLEGFGR